MKFLAQRVVHRTKLSQPATDIVWAHPSLATMLLIPVDRGNRVYGRQIGVALARVVVDSPQAAHRAIRDVRAIVLADLVVALYDQCRLPAQPRKRLIEPIL